MAQVIIRNLDDDVVLRLKERAKAKGASLEQELRRLLTEASKPTPQEKVEIAKRISDMTPTGVEQIEGWVLLNEERDRR